MPCPQGTRALSHLSTALLCPGTLRTPGQSAEHDASIQGGHQPAGDGQTLSDAPTSSGRTGELGGTPAGQGGRGGDGGGRGHACRVSCPRRGAAPLLSTLPPPATRPRPPPALPAPADPSPLKSLSWSRSGPHSQPGRMAPRACAGDPLHPAPPRLRAKLPAPAPGSAALRTRLGRRPTVQQTLGEALVPPAPSASHWPSNPACCASETPPHSTSKPLHCTTPFSLPLPRKARPAQGLPASSLPNEGPTRVPPDCDPNPTAYNLPSIPGPSA